MDFEGARRIVARHLATTYADWRESPKVLGYGFDTGTAWAPLVDWDGVMGVYVLLVNKRTGRLKPLSFPEFDAMPTPRRVGRWPESEKS